MVRFRVSDVFLPAAEAVLLAPGPEEEVDGTIIDFSDSGPKTKAFAVVDVVRRQTVVVPVAKLHVIRRPGAG
jgi:hypothetical protein